MNAEWNKSISARVHGSAMQLHKSTVVSCCARPGHRGDSYPGDHGAPTWHHGHQCPGVRTAAKGKTAVLCLRPGGACHATKVISLPHIGKNIAQGFVLPRPSELTIIVHQCILHRTVYSHALQFVCETRGECNATDSFSATTVLPQIRRLRLERTPADRVVFASTAARAPVPELSGSRTVLRNGAQALRQGPAHSRGQY